MTLIHYIETHPGVAFVVALGQYIIAANFIEHWEVPKFIMQLFQLGAFISTIVVGIIAWNKRKK